MANLQSKIQNLKLSGLVALLLVFPLVAPTYLRSLMIEVLIFAIFAMSLDLLMGYTGLVSFGHAAFFGLGGYVAAYSAQRLSANLLVTMPLLVAVLILAAFAIGFFALRTSGIYFLMLTLAFAQMLFSLVIKWSAVTGGSDGLTLDRPYIGIGGMALRFGADFNFYYLALALFLGSWWLLARLVASPFGRTLSGIRENEARMRALGYDTWRFKIAAFVIAGLFAGLAGMLLASFNRHVAPESLYWTASGQVIIMVLVGGAGSLAGPILGAALVHLLPTYISSYTDRWQSILGLVFIGFVLFAPRGIYGLIRRSSTENPAESVVHGPWSVVDEQQASESVISRPWLVVDEQQTTDHGPWTTDMTDILQLDNLRRNFGGLMAVDGVSLRVAPGERRAIIGPNGAGKTTLFNLISGELPVASGAIRLAGRDVTGRAAHERANLGMGRTFQRNNLFFGLSVFENVRLAVQHRQGISRRFFAPAARFELVNAAALELLGRIGLAAVRDTPAGKLAYGQQRALEIALALATAPRLLLLDEPTAGMSPAETAEITRLIAGLPRELTLLIIEHDMDVIFSLADRISVLHYGQVLVEGAPAEVKANPRAQEIYFGVTL